MIMKPYHIEKEAFFCDGVVNKDDNDEKINRNC